MKLAITAAGMLAGRRLADPKELLAKGGKLLGASPEVQKLTGEVRERLLDAAKSAAMAAATSKIESLGDNLTKRAAGLRAVNVEAAGEQVSNAGKGVTSLSKKAIRRGASSGETTAADEDETESEESEEEQSSEGRKERGRTPERSTASSGGRSSSAAEKESTRTPRSGERGKATSAAKSSSGSSGRAGSRSGGSAGQGKRKQATSSRPKSSAPKKTS
ncbi:hypothetical protein AB0I53_20275 [Saccharopolyspora sp. NPDC050389]|uniref:hypothetical protein n=1 Tax=Saccharopolyspora sp. NPDC050389 TaxID=3155516 RepID=UPI003405D526